MSTPTNCHIGILCDDDDRDHRPLGDVIQLLVICQGSIPDMNACVMHSLRGSLAIHILQVKLPWTFALKSDDILSSPSRTSPLGNHFISRLQNGPGLLRVQLPHWFAVLVTGFIAASPGLPFSRQSSLRTMLIATTLMAVVLGARRLAGVLAIRS